MERKITLIRNKDSTIKVVIAKDLVGVGNGYIALEFNEGDMIQLGKHLIDMGTTDISEMSLTINDKEIK